MSGFIQCAKHGAKLQACSECAFEHFRNLEQERDALKPLGGLRERAEQLVRKFHGVAEGDDITHWQSIFDEDTAEAEAALRSVRDETLREAAKAMCPHCASGKPVKRGDGEAENYWHVDKYPCHASPIQAILRLLRGEAK